MKKIFYILASAIVALGAVACDNQDFDNIAPEANGEGLTISAVVDETRVAFEGMTAKSWEKGDFVTIGGYKFDYVPDDEVFRCTAAGVEELVGQTLGATANELKPADGIKGSTFVSIEDKKIEDGVVSGYQKIESGVVGSFNKMTDKFVGKFLTKDGETVEDAKARLAEDQKAREEKRKADAAAREDAQKARIEASLEASRNAGKRN